MSQIKKITHTTDTDEVINVIGYVRESTDKQIQESDAIEVQKSRIKEFCTKNNYNLIKIISDEGVSGAKDTTERPGMLKLLEMSKNPPIQYVIIDKVDRFSRDIYEALFIKKELMRCNVKVLYAGQEALNANYDDDPLSVMMTEMMEQIMLVFAEFERKMINKRTFDGAKKKAHSGNKPTGRQPFGYEYIKNSDGKKITNINNSQAKIIKEIFTLRSSGQTLDGIANILNSKFHRNQNKEAYTDKNKIWTNQSINWILNNDYYIGKVTYAGEKINGNHIPIIDINLWNDVHAIDGRRKAS